MRTRIVPAKAAAKRAGLRVAYLTNHLSPALGEETEWRNMSLRTAGIDVLEAWEPAIPLLEHDAVIAPEPREPIIPKQLYSGFFETQLDSLLRGYGVRDLVVVGFDGFVCLGATAGEAMYRNFRVVVLRDAIEPVASSRPPSATRRRPTTSSAPATPSLDRAGRGRRRARTPLGAGGVARRPGRSTGCSQPSTSTPSRASSSCTRGCAYAGDHRRLLRALAAAPDRLVGVAFAEPDGAAGLDGLAAVAARPEIRGTRVPLLRAPVGWLDAAAATIWRTVGRRRVRDQFVRNIDRSDLLVRHRKRPLAPAGAPASSSSSASLSYAVHP